MIEKNEMKSFEQIQLSNTAELVDFQADRLADITLRLGNAAMHFARIERMPRYHDGERESDAEHSFMLALTAPELARSLELDLDLGVVSQFSTVHDLVELKTGDVATFSMSAEQLRNKAHAEQQALEQLLQELPPYTAHLLERYERQDEPEARFVRFVDKLLPLVVDINGQGERVFKEDYNVHSTEALFTTHEAIRERFREMFGDEFPDITRLHTELCRRVERLIAFD